MGSGPCVLHLPAFPNACALSGSRGRLPIHSGATAPAFHRFPCYAHIGAPEAPRVLFDGYIGTPPQSRLGHLPFASIPGANQEPLRSYGQPFSFVPQIMAIMARYRRVGQCLADASSRYVMFKMGSFFDPLLVTPYAFFLGYQRTTGTVTACGQPVVKAATCATIINSSHPAMSDGIKVGAHPVKKAAWAKKRCRACKRLVMPTEMAKDVRKLRTPGGSDLAP